jgi:hypothetical protein
MATRPSRPERRDLLPTRSWARVPRFGSTFGRMCAASTVADLEDELSNMLEAAYYQREDPSRTAGLKDPSLR